MLLTAGLNPRPSLALRLLTWTTPSLPIGAWIAAMAGGGAALSAGATALALRGGGAPDLRRQVRRDLAEPWEEESGEQRRPTGWRDRDRVVSEPRRPRPQESSAAEPESRQGWGWSGASSAAGPSREPGQPPPTVAVPFRVIRGPVADRAGGGGDRRAQAVRQPEPEAVPAGEDDWSQGSLEDW